MDRRICEIEEIAQMASLLSVRIMREEGLGAAESDLLQLVRTQPGISQKEICVQLGMDKGAVARRAVNLEQKGYLIRKSNPADARSQILYPTAKADSFRNTGAEAESEFFNWLLELLSDEERIRFCETLDLLWNRAMQESEDGYPNVCERMHRAPFAVSQSGVKSKHESSESEVGFDGQDNDSETRKEPDIWLL